MGSRHVLFSCPGQPRTASPVGRNIAGCSVVQKDLCPSHQMHAHDSPRNNFEKVIMSLTRRNILSELLKDLWALSNNHLSTFKHVAPWQLGFACPLASSPRYLACCFSLPCKKCSAIWGQISEASRHGEVRNL